MVDSLTRDHIDWLVNNDPNELLRLCQDITVPATALTFAAEAVGVLGEKAIPVLLKMLEHASPIVREGALMGLETNFTRYPEKPGLREAISVCALLDSSPAVRLVAREILEL